MTQVTSLPLLEKSGVLQLVRLSSLLLVLILAACSSQSSNEITKQLQNVLSWAATAHMVGAAWTRGAVPTVYARQTLDKTQKQLVEAIDKSSHSAADPKQRQTIQDLQRLKLTVGQMSKSVEQKDYNAIARQLQQLSAEQQQLDKLSHAAGGKQ